MALLPVNIASIRNTPMGPERPGPERPVSGLPRQAIPIRRAPEPGARMALPATFRRGGRVKRTGFAKVHKGETVVPAAATAMGAGKKKARAKGKVQKTMGEFKAGTLRSGSKKGPVVKNQKQAVAIGLSEAKREK